MEPNPNFEPMTEREAVVHWLKTTIGWKLHKIEEKTKGRSIYVFHDEDSDGWHTVHKISQGNLRWRAMQGVAIDHIPALRQQVDAIWAEYLSGVVIPHKRVPA